MSAVAKRRRYWTARLLWLQEMQRKKTNQPGAVDWPALITEAEQKLQALERVI